MPIPNTNAHQPPQSHDKRRRRKQPKPLSIIDVPDALLTRATVSALTGFSTTTLSRLAKRGELIPLRLSACCTRWRAADVSAYLAAKAGASAK